jgi:branched-chain amino acid transport system permease protein
VTAFLSTTINGALTGLLYAMIACGFVVIYRASRIFNFAQGSFVVLAGFLIVSAAGSVGLPLPLALVFGVLASGAVGWLVQAACFARLRDQSAFSLVMITIALTVLLHGYITLQWGASSRPFPELVSNRALEVNGVFISRNALLGGIIAVVSILALALFFNRSRFGLKMTAVAIDHQIASSLGISVRRSIAFAWVAGGVVSAIAAIALFNGRPIGVDDSGITLVALPVALLAGVDSIAGLLPAGVIIGCTTGLASAYLDAHLSGGASAVAPYVIMLVTMCVRPQGLFGWRDVDRV